MDLEKSVGLVIISLVIINAGVIFFTKPTTLRDAALTVFDVTTGSIVIVLALGGLAEAIDNVARTFERPAVSHGLYVIVAAFFMRILVMYKNSVDSEKAEFRSASRRQGERQ